MKQFLDTKMSIKTLLRMKYCIRYGYFRGGYPYLKLSFLCIFSLISKVYCIRFKTNAQGSFNGSYSFGSQLQIHILLVPFISESTDALFSNSITTTSQLYRVFDFSSSEKMFVWGSSQSEKLNLTSRHCLPADIDTGTVYNNYRLGFNH